MLIGALATRTQVPKTTLENYIARGLLKVQGLDGNGNRVLPEDSVPRVLLIRRLTRAGFKLMPIAVVLAQHSVEEIGTKLSTLPTADFQCWFMHDVGGSAVPSTDQTAA